ncbi:MAG: hypothetical protein KKD94_03445 [Nanoarchaeota archaeon]|nr:hypothetical protein [Nanoarchaeota archaeon]
MNPQQKFSLLKKNTEEIITEQALLSLLKKKKQPVVYCGYEPSGPLHLGHFVTITKLMDFVKAGFKVKVLLADIHAMLNKKGQEKEIEKEVTAWKKTVKAIGLKCEIVLGSTFQFSKQYQFDIFKLAQQSTISRGLRSMQEIARDIKNIIPRFGSRQISRNSLAIIIGPRFGSLKNRNSLASAWIIRIIRTAYQVWN